jgi:parvulin-like peptidyl-prolyl isomerase
MQKAIEELQARAEQEVDAVEVQHLLVSFKGAPRMPASVTRSREEAEALTAEIWAQLQEGADFDALIREHTDDQAPGIYPMSRSSRGKMVRAFGDTGWRLEVGEYGIAPHDPEASPFGWHVIKRLK